MEYTLEIFNRSHDFESITMIANSDQTCYIEQNPNIRGEILKDTTEELVVKWLNKNYVQKYKRLDEFTVECIFDKVDTTNFIDTNSLQKQKNELQSVCLLTCEKEIGSEKYKSFIKNLIECTRAEEAHDIEFNIMLNKNGKIIPQDDIDAIQKVFKNCHIVDLDIIPQDDIYIVNRRLAKDTCLPDLGYISGPNVSFFESIKKCKDYNTTLFIECDCLMGVDWLLRIKNYVDNCGRFWISGAFYDGIQSRIKNRQHINGGTALYATGDDNFQKFISATALYLKYKVEIGYKFYPYDYAMFDFIKTELDDAIERRDQKKIMLWNYINRHYIKNNLIYNLCTKADSSMDYKEFYRLYDFAILHTKFGGDIELSNPPVSFCKNKNFSPFEELTEGMPNSVKIIKVYSNAFENYQIPRLESACDILIIDCSHEGGKIFSECNINKFIKLCKDRHRCEVIFLTMNEKASNDIDIYYSNFSWSLYHQNQYKRVNLNHGSKKFTYLGGFARPDKVNVLLGLWENDLLNSALWSFGKVPNAYIKHLSKFKTILSTLPKNLDIDLDNKGSVKNRTCWKEINESFYNTRFSLVQETETEHLSNRYTEKTLKCLTIGHPFIVAGNYQVLRLLKKDGFKTFSPYINEEYDEIPDRKDRIAAVINETKRLCDMSSEQWDDLLEKIEPILEYNFNHSKTLKEKKKDLANNIIKRYRKCISVVGAGGCGQTFFTKFLTENGFHIENLNNGWEKHPSKINSNSKCIFMYGDPLLTVLSHFRRNEINSGWNGMATDFLENPNGLTNNDISDIDAYFDLVRVANKDLWGIKEQFKEWLKHSDIMFIQAEEIPLIKKDLNIFVEKELDYRIWENGWRGRGTENLISQVPDDIQKIYQDLYLWMKNSALKKSASVKSFSQIGQDDWVLKQTNYKKNGYFIEAGASDGLNCSNTYKLEKAYGWSGICCEPNNQCYESLNENRSCSLESKCLYKTSGESLDFYNCDMLGGIGKHFYEPKRHKERMASLKTIVESISLSDMLDKHNAPKDIDYISLDTEGSELCIVEGFDFSKYDVNLWTIEHNGNEETLKRLIKIFTGHGYDYKIVKFDVWFFKERPSKQT